MEQNSNQKKFGCPCGKVYFSYPALFTHVKQKHDGKPPGQLQRPKSKNKRGRPRKYPVPQPGETAKVSEENSRMKDDEPVEEDLMTRLRKAKERYSQASIDFRGPIQSSSGKSPRAPPAGPLDTLMNRIKRLFTRLQEGIYPDQLYVRRLLDVNIFYKQKLNQVDRSLLRPNKGEETLLKIALIKFKEWLQNLLNDEALVNAQLLIGLMMHFYERVLLGSGVVFRTGNYVQQLNNFTQHFIYTTQQQSCYQQVFIMQSRNVSQFLCCFHLWLCECQMHFDYTVASQAHLMPLKQ